MTKTVTLSTALKLKEAGWVKETEYYLDLRFEKDELRHRASLRMPEALIQRYVDVDLLLSMPGIELLEELPKGIVHGGEPYALTIVILNKGCHIAYNHLFKGSTQQLHPVSGDNIFEALAELVILKLTDKL